MKKPAAVTTSLPAPQDSDRASRSEIALLERRLEFQRLLGEISSDFINLPPPEIDNKVTQALGRVATFLGFNVSTISKFVGAGSVGEITHIWTADNLPPIPPGFTEMDFPWVAERLTQNHPVHLSRLDDLPAQAQQDRRTLERFGIQSAFNWPLPVGGAGVVGCLAFASAGRTQSFPDEFKPGLELLRHIVGGTLARARADQALCEREERVNLAAEAAGVGLWSLDLATNRFWLTPKTRELFHFQPDEAVTLERFLSLIHPDDHPLVRQAVQEVIQSRQARQIQYRIAFPDGCVRWFHTQGRVYSSQGRRPDCLMGVTMDITARQVAERTRADNEARLTSAIDVAGLGFYEMRIEPLSHFLDERLRALLGLTTEEGQRAQDFWLEHVHPEDRPQILELSRQVMQGGLDGLAKEYRYLHPQRGTIWLSQISRVLERAADGRAVRRMGVIRDITEQRRAELEVHELRVELAHSDRVTLLGQLASALAHELSQPLGAILRNAEAAELMLQESAPDLEELRAIVADIVRDDQRAGKVIDHLRSLLKRRSMDLQLIELSELITEVLMLIQTDAAARQVKIVYAALPKLSKVHGDRVHLQQVLLNLLVNGMDALAETTPTDRCLHVAAQLVAPGLVEVLVRDNGPGIKADILDRLFQPFFTTKTNGMGMGLAVSKTIIETHRGKLWAENHPEGGACFRFTLPVAEPPRGE